MLELALVKLSRPELDLVKLSRPGWFVPNSSDLVKAKALQQKEDLPKNFFSKFRKEVRAAVCLASLRGGSEGTTPPTVNTCPVCDAVLDTPIQVKAHLQGQTVDTCTGKTYTTTKEEVALDWSHIHDFRLNVDTKRKRSFGKECK